MKKLIRLAFFGCLLLLVAYWMLPGTDEQGERPRRENTAGEERPTPVYQPGRVIQCQGKGFKLEQFLNDHAASVEAQRILYNSEPLSDCSGIFLRLCQALQGYCPAYAFPDAAKVRDTRRLARWFYDHHNLRIIQQAEASGELIRPGAVLFYGRQGKKFTAITIDKITAATGIQHVGVVTEVEKDADGKVINYTLFHGRSSGKIASRTTYHQRKPDRNGYPPYGNGSQQWVAIGFILTPE